MTPIYNFMAAVMQIGLPHVLTLGALLFVLGVICITTRKHTIGILMGVELMLNAASINFLAFYHFTAGHQAGLIFPIFIIVLAAAEAAVALAIVISMFSNFGTVMADEANELKE